MKKIIEKVLLTMLVLVLFIGSAGAQKPKKDTTQHKTSQQQPKIDDVIPNLPDSIYFVNNKDLLQVYDIMKKVMSSDQYKQAGDVISQFELLAYYVNQVFFQAKTRWEQKNKIPVTTKDPALQAEPDPIQKNLN